jgi:hypothetical protein
MRQDDATRDTTSATNVERLYTLPEAAASLGCSLAAVRKRRERGQLRGVLREGRWYVWLRPPETGDTARDSGHDSRHDTGDMSQALVHHLSSEVELLRDALAVKDRQIGELHVLLQRALEQRDIPTLAPPAEPKEQPEDSPPSAPASEPEPTSPQRKTWRWWRGWQR